MNTRNRKIRLLLGGLIITMLAVMLSSCSSAKDGLSYKIEGNEVIITSYKDKTTVNEVVIPDEIEGKPVTKIDEFGVMNAESLKKITIGKNVKYIGGWAFSGDPALVEFAVSDENEYFTAVDGILYTKDMKTLVYCPPAKEYKDGVFKVPDGVETIRTKAFYKCDKIKEIVIPDSVKSIEEKSFHKCTALEKVTLSESSNLEFIGKDCFAYCENLSEMTIPSKIKQIDEYAFYNCKKFLDVKVMAKEKNIKLGKKWYPTNNGQDIEEVKISWQ